MSRPDWCFATSSRRNSSWSRWQVVERVDDREPRTHAKKEGDLAQERVQVDDDGRALGGASELTRAVHRDGRGPASPLRAEERERPAALTGAGLGRPHTRRNRLDGLADTLDQRLGRLERVGRPGKELVGPGAHRPQDQVGLGHASNRHDRQRWPPRPDTLDAGQRGRAGPDVDDGEIGRRREVPPILDDADRGAARAEQRGYRGAKLRVLCADDRCQLCHARYLVFTRSRGSRPIRVDRRAEPPAHPRPTTCRCCRPAWE